MNLPVERWLIAVPNEGKTEQEKRSFLENSLRNYADVHALTLPQQVLKVGTLDSLVGVCDDLVKLDANVDQLIRRVARTYHDVFKHEAEFDKDGGLEDKKSDRGPGKQAREAPPLSVARYKTNNSPEPEYLRPEEYVEGFAWWNRRYAENTSMHALAEKIQNMATKAEGEMKKFTNEYGEVRTKVMAIERVESGSLLVQPLEKYVMKTDIIETGAFTTLIVVVPRLKEEEFVKTYADVEEAYVVEKKRQKEENAKREAALLAAQKEAAAEQEAEEEGADGKSALDNNLDEALLSAEAKAAPVTESKAESKNNSEDGVEQEPEEKSNLPQCFNVVPRSALRLHPRGDGPVQRDSNGEFPEFVLYRVMVMRKGVDTVKKAFREKRYTVREFAFNTEGYAEEAKEKAKLLKRRTKLWQFLVNWCKTYYSDLFTAWMHVKAIRVFVEAVLRFGLPVAFTASVITPKSTQHEKRCREILQDIYKSLDHADLSGQLENAEFDLSGFGGDFYPYVSVGVKLG